MKIEKVYIDMDGVLANFNLGVHELCGLPYINNYTRVGNERDEMWDEIRKVDHFYGKLKPMPGAIEMFRELYQTYGDRCEILTGIPLPFQRIEHSGDDKIEWVHRYLSEKIKINIVYAAEKKKFCTGKEAVLIDDYIPNIKSWVRQGGTGILHQNPESTLEQIRRIEADVI